jgi:hypothetical protein
MKLLPPPGPQRRRQLGLLVLLFAGVGYLLWSRMGPGPAVAPPVASNTQMPSATTPSALPEPLNLASLEPVPDEPASGRNPFRFGELPPPPRPAAPPPVVAPPPPARPPGPPPIPPVPLKLIGLSDWPDGHKRAILSDGKGGVFTCAEGDVVDGRYRLVKVGLTSAVVSYLDGSGQRTIPLGG